MPNERDSSWSIGLLTVVMTLAGWSVVPLFIKFFAGHIDAWTSNGWRYGFSAILWAPLILIGLTRKNLPKGLWIAAIVPALINSAGQVCFTLAHYMIDPGLLTFGLRAQIVFVTIGAALLFPSERGLIRRPMFLVGLAMVALGTIGTVLLGPGLGDSATVLGVALAMGAGAGFACYALAVRWFLKGIPAMTAFAAISQYTALAMITLMLLLGERMGATALDLSPMNFLWLLVSAIIGIALGHVFYYISIERLGVTVSSGVIQLQPFTVAIASFFIFGEVLTGPQWMSGSVAVLGATTILVVQHLAKRADRRAAAQQAGVAGIAGADEAEFAELPPDHVAAAACVEDEAGLVGTADPHSGQIGSRSPASE